MNFFLSYWDEDALFVYDNIDVSSRVYSGLASPVSILESSLVPAPSSPPWRMVSFLLLLFGSFPSFFDAFNNRDFLAFLD